MNKRQYKMTLIVFGLVAAAAIIVTSVWYNEYLIWAFIALSVGYIYIRYKITTPLQRFSTKFNMLVDYDLDVEGALELAKEQYENAPTEQVGQLLGIYLGMGYYYNSRYDEAIKTLNLVKLNKVNQVYHILIHAFTAYAAYELNDTENFDLAVERIETAKQRINKKYFAFASSYPEGYREIIERNFSREDGYVSTRLVYNYRMALYFKKVGNLEEMDKCLARVIANGKNHHTAVRSRSLFTGTVNVEDYVFAEPGTEAQEVEVVENPLQIDQLQEVDVAENDFIAEADLDKELFDEPVVEEVVAEKPVKEYASMSVSELRDICRNNGVYGYYKMKKADLIAEIEKLNK
jgi:tetratricopeptide (TPR) repeat protein